MKHVIAVGDAFNGITLYGPYASHNAALDAAISACYSWDHGTDYNIISLQSVLNLETLETD